jgi:hypothetical protein
MLIQPGIQGAAVSALDIIAALAIIGRINCYRNNCSALKNEGIKCKIVLHNFRHVN